MVVTSTYNSLSSCIDGKSIVSVGRNNRNPNDATLADFICLDHSYAKLWSAHPDATNAKTAKFLFMQKYSRSYVDNSQSKNDEVDVVTEPGRPLPLYDNLKAQHAMNEILRFVSFARQDENLEDVEEKINKTNWTTMQNRLYNKVMKILQADKLSRLSCEGHPNEPILRRIQVDKSTHRLRQVLAGISWDLKTTQWLHSTMLDNLSQSHLVIYLDILQTLKIKVPKMVDKMISLSIQSRTSNDPSMEALNLLLKRPWDPVCSMINQRKHKRLPGNPLILVAPCGPNHNPSIQSRRIRYWNNQLASLGKVIPVTMHFHSINGGNGVTVQQCTEHMISAMKTKVNELKNHFPSRPIVLLGWNVGALISLHTALTEYVTAAVCLGFPFMGIEGGHGDADDTLLDLKIPTLFVVGQNATTCKIDDIEDFRERIHAETSLVVIGGSDDLLRMKKSKKKREGLTQPIVDQYIQDEVAEFLGGVISQQIGSAPDLDGVDNLDNYKKKIKKKSSLEHSELSMVNTIDTSKFDLQSLAKNYSLVAGQMGGSAIKRTLTNKKSNDEPPSKQIKTSLSNVGFLTSQSNLSIPLQTSELTGLLTGSITPQSYSNSKQISSLLNISSMKSSEYKISDMKYNDTITAIMSVPQTPSLLTSAESVVKTKFPSSYKTCEKLFEDSILEAPITPKEESLSSPTNINVLSSLKNMKNEQTSFFIPTSQAKMLSTSHSNSELMNVQSLLTSNSLTIPHSSFSSSNFSVPNVSSSIQSLLSAIVKSMPSSEMIVSGSLIPTSVSSNDKSTVALNNVMKSKPIISSSKNNSITLQPNSDLIYSNQMIPIITSSNKSNNRTKNTSQLAEQNKILSNSFSKSSDGSTTFLLTSSDSSAPEYILIDNQLIKVNSRSNESNAERLNKYLMYPSSQSHSANLMKNTNITFNDCTSSSTFGNFSKLSSNSCVSPLSSKDSELIKSKNILSQLNASSQLENLKDDTKQKMSMPVSKSTNIIHETKQTKFDKGYSLATSDNSSNISPQLECIILSKPRTSSDSSNNFDKESIKSESISTVQESQSNSFLPLLSSTLFQNISQNNLSSSIASYPFKTSHITRHTTRAKHSASSSYTTTAKPTTSVASTRTRRIKTPRQYDL